MGAFFFGIYYYFSVDLQALHRSIDNARCRMSSGDMILLSVDLLPFILRSQSAHNERILFLLHDSNSCYPQRTTGISSLLSKSPFYPTVESIFLLPIVGEGFLTHALPAISFLPVLHTTFPTKKISLPILLYRQCIP
ncbi:unnamed protein product, partial [Choristocarpus tenellus]